MQRKEAGVIEAYTVAGSGRWHLCKSCLTEFILFTKAMGTTMSIIDKDFASFSIEFTDDIDVAEHHALCECQECLQDGDADRKFLLENDHDFFQQVYKSA